MNYRFSFFAAPLGCVAALSVLSPARAQLRIASWNSSGNTGADVQAVLTGIGVETHSGIAKPIDVLLLQESSGESGTAQSYVNMLNTIYGANTYAHGTLDGATTGAGTQSIVYRKAAVQLVSEVAVGTTSATGQARQQVRHEIRPIGYGSGASIFLYNGHFKSADGTEEAGRRNVEATNVRTSADALGQGANVMYAGDYNVYRSSEAMWGTLTGAGNGQAFDPLNKVDGKASIGSWTNNAAFREFQTQSPVTTARYGGQTTGGMDDRFDYQLVSGEMTDGAGVSYIAGTYHAFGNTNTHTVNGEITSGSASAFAALLPGYSNTQAANLLESIAKSCDHLAIVADYQIPAAMSVSVSTTPTSVLVGANVNLTATVSNSAAVSFVNGADTLAFSVTGTGALSGGGTGTDAALGAGVDKTLALATTVAGLRSGAVGVTSSSEAVLNGTFSQNVSVNVLDHANASFSSLTDTDTLTIDFGTVAPGGGTLTQNFSIANLVATTGFTAGLDLDSFSATGDTGVFGTNLAAFFNRAAGTSGTFGANFSPNTPGSFSASYTLLFSDQDLPGAASVGNLRLNLVGRVAAVVPEAGTFALLLPALGVFMVARRRK